MKRLLIINFFTSVFIILFLEVAIGYLQLSQLMGIESDKLYSLENGDYKYKSNTSGLVFNKIVYTEKNGFRAPSPNFNYDKEKKSIIFFGDSVTFGNGVDENKTFVGLMRKKFNQYNFYNLSLPGFQITNHEKNFIFLDQIENIEKIFYIYTLNDIDLKNNLESSKMIDQERDLNFIEKARKIKLFRQLNGWLRNKSYLYIYLKGIASDPSSRNFKYDYNLYANSNLIDQLNIFLNKFKKKVEFKKKELIVIILPYEFQTRKDKCSNNIFMPQKKLEEILEKENIKYYNLSNLFCEYKKPKDLFYKFDPMHLSEKGHKLTFNFLLNEVFN